VQTTVDLQDIYRRAGAGFAARVHRVGGRWADPTPLPGWDVRALVHHLVEEQRWAVPLLAGATIQQVGDQLGGDLLGDDPVAAFDAAAAAAMAAVQAEGALEGTVHLSFGDCPGREYVMQLAADHLVHTWDLDRALGVDEPLDPAAVAAVRAWFGEHEPAYRQAGLIGPRVEVGPGAGALAELLGMFGRTP
jgi:uncharacterized protein (TIGR03086 family)